LLAAHVTSLVDDLLGDLPTGKCAPCGSGFVQLFAFAKRDDADSWSKGAAKPTWSALRRLYVRILVEVFRLGAKKARFYWRSLRDYGKKCRYACTAESFTLGKNKRRSVSSERSS
jgi:hypothetical protein